MRKLKKMRKKPYVFAILYGILLAGAAAYVLLDMFVIPQDITQVKTDPLNTSNIDSSTPSGSYSNRSYQDENIAITIQEKEEYNTQVYIVDIELSDLSLLKTALAEDTYGRNVKETTSSMAERVSAILAINGDYYGFRNKGYVLRNGTLYRAISNSAQDLVIKNNGEFTIIQEDEVAAEELLADAWQVFSFGPALLEAGEIAVEENTEVGQAKTSNPRTAIGMVSPLHYIIIVSDGRTEESEGLTLYQLAAIFQEEGCETAYNLDGGGSSTLWFNGEIINTPTDGRKLGERGVSDIVYIGYE